MKLTGEYAILLGRGIVLGTLITVAGGLARSQLVPTFTGKDLTGAKVSSRLLVGRPAFLVVTTDLRDLDEALEWNRLLERELKSEARILHLLALETPKNAPQPSNKYIEQAKSLVPKALWGKTWVTDKDEVKRQLIPSPSPQGPAVLVTDGTGQIFAKATGRPDDEELRKVTSTYLSATAESADR